MRRSTGFCLSSLSALTLFATACVAPQPTARVTSGGGPSIGQAQAEVYNGPKARIAVSNFKDKTAKGYHRIGEGMADMLATALFNSNRFIVLERQQLNEVLQEQDLATSGRIKQETAAPTGEIEGAELLITGAVTEFEPNASGVGGGLGLANLPFAIGAGMKKSHVAIDYRIIDTKTSRILAAGSVEGSASDIGGLGGIGIGGGSSRMGIGLGGFAKTPMEKAIRVCIQAAVNDIAGKTPAQYYHN